MQLANASRCRDAATIKSGSLTGLCRFEPKSTRVSMIKVALRLSKAALRGRGSSGLQLQGELVSIILL
jgi:hypothetical protein